MVKSYRKTLKKSKVCLNTSGCNKEKFKPDHRLVSKSSMKQQSLKIHIKSIENVNKTLKLSIKVGMNRKNIENVDKIIYSGF